MSRTLVPATIAAAFGLQPATIRSWQHRGLISAVAWEVVRAGGYVREGDGKDIRFATVERLDSGFHMVIFHDDRVLSACMRLGDWDGCTTKGPVRRTLKDALALAERAVSLTLELAWAKGDAESAIYARHGVGA